MRVLIYGEDENALSVLREELGTGSRASLRAADVRLFDPSRPEPCDRAWAWQEEIRAAYRERGTEVLPADKTRQEAPAAAAAQPKRPRKR